MHKHTGAAEADDDPGPLEFPRSLQHRLHRKPEEVNSGGNHLNITTIPKH